MLFLVTGLPGNGKTLWCINHVEELRQKSNREVWYHGITDLTLPWKKLEDPKRWDSVPPGSIVVIDECQDVFPNRRQGADVPDYVERLTRHRHLGLDIFLITQEAMNFDVFARRLVARHFHLKRPFGMSRSRLYTWEGLGNPGDFHSKREAAKSWFSFPKASFSWYRSAEVHTVKRDLPWMRLGAIAGALVAVVAAIWYAVAMLGDSTGASAETKEGGAPGGLMGSSSYVAAEWRDNPLKPRIEGIPQSAPMFDAVGRPVQAPRISGCGALQRGSYMDCKCTDQQGNVIPMDKQQCLSALQSGVFDYQDERKRYPEIVPYVPPLAPPSYGMETMQPGEGQAGANAPPPPPAGPSA